MSSRKSKNETARAKRRANIVRFRDQRPATLPGHKAARHGTGSAEWNRYLAGLQPTDRAAAIKAMRDLNWMSVHIACGPTSAENPRFGIGR